MRRGESVMVMPSQSQIELPLLLEIDAAGGEAEPRDLYARVASHFPELTPWKARRLGLDRLHGRRKETYDVG